LQADFRQTVCFTFINTHRAADSLRQTSAVNHSKECEMSVPQKERPASVLRAAFAGVGSLLSFMDRVRGKSATEAPAPTVPVAVTPEATAKPEAAAPETVVAETATPEETVAAETVVAETVTPEETAAAEPAAEPATVVAETATPETAAAETAAPEATAELPLANYDELTVASLRARLRNLSVDQLNQLIEYEKGHAARADVITMFERRIAKVEAEA
jgi:hypothetical protein